MSSTLISRHGAAPHQLSARARVEVVEPAGQTLRQRLASTYGPRKSAPVAIPRPRGSNVGTSVKFSQTAATHIPAAAVQPAAAYNKIEQALNNDTSTVPIAQPWTPEYAAGLLSTRGKEAAKALAEPSLEEIALELEFALQRAASDTDKDRLEDQLVTLRALAAEEKRRGELSPEQQQLAREIALEVASRHETAAAAAESFLREKQDAEAANLAAGQSLLEADLEAKRELDAALRAEAEAAGLKAVAEEDARVLKGELEHANTELEQLKGAKDQYTQKMSDLRASLQRFRGPLEIAKASGDDGSVEMVREAARPELEQYRAVRAVLDEASRLQKKAIQSKNKAANALKERLELVKDLEIEQANASFMKSFSEAVAQDAAQDLASFTAAPPPQYYPQARSQTRRQQKAALLESAVERGVSRAAPRATAALESAVERGVSRAAALAAAASPPVVQTTGRAIDIIKRVADDFNVSYNSNANRQQIFNAIKKKNPEAASSLVYLVNA